MTKSDEPVTIKKYANRRLYNTGTSTYVTLEDLAAMVKAGEDFVVYDAKTGEDITRSVLAQIIFEQENKEGQNLLPIKFLRQLIRFYGDSMQMLVPRYLEVSLESLTREVKAGPVGNDAMKRPFLATDRVRFVGEPVAAVLTEQPYQGPDAAELVVVDYDPLDVVVDPLAAPAEATVSDRSFSYGDPDGAFATAHLVVERRFRFPRWAGNAHEMVRLN